MNWLGVGRIESGFSRDTLHGRNDTDSHRARTVCAGKLNRFGQPKHQHERTYTQPRHALCGAVCVPCDGGVVGARECVTCVRVSTCSGGCSSFAVRGPQREIVASELAGELTVCKRTKTRKRSRARAACLYCMVHSIRIWHSILG